MLNHVGQCREAFVHTLYRMIGPLDVLRHLIYLLSENSLSLSFMACNSVDKIGLSSGMVSKTKRHYKLGGFFGEITPSHASYQVLTNTSGMVQPVEGENL
jgi:hypothetical protein